MEQNDLNERLKKIRYLQKKGKAELNQMENLISKDGIDVRKLDANELYRLLNEKENELGKRLSEQALHVLAAGRCAGSYGCGINPIDGNPPC